MTFGWQELVVAVIVLAAAGYLARAGWRLLRRNAASSCGGGCGDCPTTQGEPQNMVQIDLTPAKPRSDTPKAT